MNTEIPPPKRNLPLRPVKSQEPGYSIFKGLQSIFISAIIVATLLTLWTPTNLFTNELLTRMAQAVQSNPTRQASSPSSVPSSTQRIGIIAGHWGNDPGARCPDGLSEVDVNLRIATLVKLKLMNVGYEVDLLQEFDDLLNNYQGLVLVSIHNDSCNYINNEATGFKVAGSMLTPFPEKTNRLTACLVARYKSATQLSLHAGSITNEMTLYHAFKLVNQFTTAAIIETGFLNLDRRILTEEPDRVAQGVTNGILCYLRNESIDTDEPTLKP